MCRVVHILAVGWQNASPGVQIDTGAALDQQATGNWGESLTAVAVTGIAWSALASACIRAAYLAASIAQTSLADTGERPVLP